MYCLGNGGKDLIIGKLGGAGIIMSNEFTTDIAFPNLIPGTFVSVNDGEKIDKYINSTRLVILFSIHCTVSKLLKRSSFS